MLSTTFDLLKAALRSDPTVSARNRNHFLAYLRNGGNPPNSESVTAAAPRILRRRKAAERLSLSLRSVDKLAAQGVLPRVRLPGRTRAAGFREEDVNKLLAS